MTDDKPKQKDWLVLDVVETSADETKAKADAVKNFQVGVSCPQNLGDDNRDKREIDPTVAGSYAAGQQVTDPYTHKTKVFQIRIKLADGHHGPDRDNLTQNDPGTTENPGHEHDDWKRSPPEVIDQNPERSRIGYQSQFRVPDSAGIYNWIRGGDELGDDTDTRARYHGEGPLGPGDKLEFPASDRAKQKRNPLTDEVR